jgi:hypothetical protein
VEEAKASSWRRATAAIAYKQKELWKLEKWAKLRSWVLPKSVTIPSLCRSEGDDRTQITHKEKSGLFAERFFPNSTADPTTLEAAIAQFSRNQFPVFQRVTSDEIEDILQNTKPWKAPEKDNIPAGLLKACGKPLYRMLVALIISSFEVTYFSYCFKMAKVIMLSKSNKTIAQKSTPGA